MPTTNQVPEFKESAAPRVRRLVEVVPDREDLIAPDSPLRRFGAAALVSVLVNAAVWWSVSGAIRSHLIPPTVPIEVTRVVLNKDRKILPVKVKPRVLPRPKPKPITPKPEPVARVKQALPPKPSLPQPHVHVVAIAPSPTAPAADVHTGGNLSPGTPVASQGTGDQATPPPPAPVAAPSPSQPPPPPTPEPVPPPPTPKPIEPIAPKPPPPVPVGPTVDAQPTNQVKPDIPDDLKNGEYKSFVRVKVVVRADGTFTPTLRTSSGNADIDQHVLDALRRWQWKPALKDGDPVESTQYFRFEFVVE